MNTTYAVNEPLNMSSNERGFRAVASLALLVSILVGFVTAPAAIFGLSLAKRKEKEKYEEEEKECSKVKERRDSNANN